MSLASKENHRLRTVDLHNFHLSLNVISMIEERTVR